MGLIEREYCMNYDLASRKRRFFSAWIDGMISVSLIKLIVLLFGISYQEYINKDTFESGSIALATILITILIFILYVFFPTYVWKGQTIGKYLLKIKVIKDSNESVNLKTMSLRSIFDLLSQINIPFFSATVGIIFLIDPFFIFSKNKKTLHDIIAKTKVIDLKKVSVEE